MLLFKLKNLMLKLATDSGATHVFYSHHNNIDLKSLNNCLQMTRANSVGDKSGSTSGYKSLRINNFYCNGVRKILIEYSKPKTTLAQLLPQAILPRKYGVFSTKVNSDNTGSNKNYDQSESGALFEL